MDVDEYYELARLEDASKHDGLFDEAADGKWDYVNQLHPLAYHENRLEIINQAIAKPRPLGAKHSFCSYKPRKISMGDIAIPDTCITTADLDMSLLWSLYGGTTRVMNWFKIRYCEMTVDQLQSRLEAYEGQHKRYHKAGDHELIAAGSARCMLLQDAIERVGAHGKRKRFDMTTRRPPWGAGFEAEYLAKIASPFEQHRAYQPPKKVEGEYAESNSLSLESSLLGPKPPKSPEHILAPEVVESHPPRADSLSPMSDTFALQDITPYSQQSNAANLPPRRTRNSRFTGLYDADPFAIPSPVKCTLGFAHRNMRTWLNGKPTGTPSDEFKASSDNSPPAYVLHLSNAGGYETQVKDRQMASILKHVNSNMRIIDGTDPSLEEHGLYQKNHYRQTVPELRGGYSTSPKRKASGREDSGDKKQKTTEGGEEEEEYDPEHPLFMALAREDAYDLEHPLFTSKSEDGA